VSVVSDKQGLTNEAGIRSALILAQTQSIAGVTIAPFGVVERAYPAPPAGVTLGTDLMESAPAPYRNAIDRAVRTRNTSLVTVYDSRTGKRDILAWHAVYVGGDLWGLLSMQIDLEHVFTHLGDRVTDPPIEIAVRSAQGELLYGNESVFVSQPATQSLAILDSHWVIAAIPAAGWGRSFREQENTFIAFGAMAVVFLFSLSYMALSRHSMLEVTVRERTREVNRINRELAADVERRKRLEADHQELLEQLAQRVEQRTHHLSALYDVSAVASSSLDLPTVLESSLDRILAVMGCDAASVHLYQQIAGGQRRAFIRQAEGEAQLPACPLSGGDEPQCWVYEHRQPVIIRDTSTDLRTRYAYDALGPRSHVGVPIRGPQGPVGVLCVFRSCDRPFTEEEATLLAAIADHLGVAVDNARLFAEAQGKATLEERQRLARELHDSVTQLLYSSALIAEAARRSCASASNDRMRELLSRLGSTVQQALRETRLLVYELRPLSLVEDGLGGALQRRLDAVERRAGVQADLSVQGVVQLPPQVEEALYRIAQEALNNTLKHAGARAVAVEIRGTSESVFMRVSDDGKGFDAKQGLDRGGLGLGNMRERTERLGGSFAICSGADQGTAIEVDVPFAGKAGLAGVGYKRDSAGVLTQ
jgi:signal transduction histidine kinase